MRSNQFRILLLIILAFVGMQIYVAWEKMYPAKDVKANSEFIAKDYKKFPAQNNFDVHSSPKITDNTFKETSNLPKSLQVAQLTGANPIEVSTNVFNLLISPIDGSITQLGLKKYNKSLQDKTPLILFDNQKDNQYLAENNYIVKDNNKTINYKSEKTSYTMNADKLNVVLTANQDGLIYTKTYTFSKDSYDINVFNKITNNSGKVISAYFEGALLRNNITSSQSLLSVHDNMTFSGAIVSSQDKHFRKVTFDDMKSDPVSIKADSGWAVMAQHYFISAFVPSFTNGSSISIFAKQVDNDLFATGFQTSAFTLNNGESKTYSSQLYVGPTIQSVLDGISPHLGLTVDYGWLWFISDLLFVVLSFLFSIVGNWGVAIILVTFLIKLIFFPLSARSYRSMGKMRLLQPKLKALKEQFGDDKQKMSQAMMAMYKKEKVNPLGGCLPMIVQIPVFIALYWVLIESVQLREAPFFFWIHDLSMKDPYYVLPVLMGLSMFAQQRLNPAPIDPIQAKVMMFMPVIFTVLFASFPSGLVLYWLTNNLLSIAQQWWIMKGITNESKKKKVYINK